MAQFFKRWIAARLLLSVGAALVVLLVAACSCALAVDFAADFPTVQQGYNDLYVLGYNYTTNDWRMLLQPSPGFYADLEAPNIPQAYTFNGNLYMHPSYSEWVVITYYVATGGSYNISGAIANDVENATTKLRVFVNDQPGNGLWIGNEIWSADAPAFGESVGFSQSPVYLPGGSFVRFALDSKDMALGDTTRISATVTPAVPDVVPEPSSLLALGAGVIGAVARVRRRR